MISNVTKQNNSQGSTSFKGSVKFVGNISHDGLKAVSDIAEFAERTKFLGNEVHVVAAPRAKDSHVLNVDIYPFGKKPFWQALFKPDAKFRVEVSSKISKENFLPKNVKKALQERFSAFTEEFYGQYYKNNPKQHTPREVLRQMTETKSRESLDCAIKAAPQKEEL